MKWRILLLMLLIGSGLVAQVTKQALFLGNSYTYFNNLPDLIADIASSMGDSLYTDQNTPGGYTLQGHSTNATSLSKINARNWDYVVMQEQSQRPSFSPAQVASDVFPYAKTLADKVHANDSCSEVLYYMTWGRKYGDQSNCQFYPPICTYAGMQQRLRDSYVQMANDNDGSVSPVGIAWKAFMAVDSVTNLYTADNSHPSLYGSYLAACVFYSSMFHKSSLGSYVPSGVNSGTAFVMQNIADQVVFDSLQTWRIDTSQSINAHFDYVKTSGYQVQFTDQSDSADSWFWEFGTGDTSILQNPVYTYQGPGQFQVRLTVSRNCLTSQFDSLVEYDVIGLQENSGNSKVRIFPNPAHQYLFVESVNDISEISIVQLATGQIVFSDKNFSPNDGIDIGHLEKGMYIVEIVQPGSIDKFRVMIK